MKYTILLALAAAVAVNAQDYVTLSTRTKSHALRTQPLGEGVHGANVLLFQAPAGRSVMRPNCLLVSTSAPILPKRL